MSKLFTEKDRFKRFLQTDPDILNAYLKKERVINSVQPVKKIVIHENIKIRAPNTTPGKMVWPRRVMFPEQIPILYCASAPVWLVKNLLHTQPDMPFTNHMISEAHECVITKINKPAIIALHETPKIEPGAQLDTTTIRKIDSHMTAFYLADNTEKRVIVAHLTKCGIVPGIYSYNAVFYDREIAYLYAESYQEMISNKHINKHTT